MYRRIYLYFYSFQTTSLQIRYNRVLLLKFYESHITKQATRTVHTKCTRGWCKVLKSNYTSIHPKVHNSFFMIVVNIDFVFHCSSLILCIPIYQRCINRSSYDFAGIIFKCKIFPRLQRLFSTPLMISLAKS